MRVELILMTSLRCLSAMRASTVVGHIRDFERKGIVCIRVCLVAGIVAVEGGCGACLGGSKTCKK
jgi:hypothetical protein